MGGIEHFNYPKFFEAEAILEERYGENAIIYNPARIDSEKDIPGSKPRPYYIWKSIELMLKCDSIYFLDGWQNSEGAKLEYEIARQLNFNFLNFNDMFETDFISSLNEVNIMEEAQHLINGPRKDQYGPPQKNLADIGKIWSIVLGLDKDITATQVALMMAGLKIARESHCEKYDNRLDTIAYMLIRDNLIRHNEINN